MPLLFVSNEDAVLEGAPVWSVDHCIKKKKRIYIIVSVVFENRHYDRGILMDIFLPNLYIYHLDKIKSIENFRRF